MHRSLMQTSCRTTRRTFLTAAAAAAAPLVVPGSALGLSGAVSANEAHFGRHDWQRRTGESVGEFKGVRPLCE